MNIMNYWIKYIYLNFHILLSLSLFFIEEYTALIILQIGAFSFILRYRKLLYIFYIPILFFSLIKIFASSNYIFYFIDLIGCFFTLYLSKNILNYIEIFLFSLYLFLLSFFYLFLEEQRYDIYTYFNIVDKIYFIDNITLFTLLLLQLLVLFVSSKPTLQ